MNSIVHQFCTPYSALLTPEITRASVRSIDEASKKNGEEEKYHANYLTRRLNILKTQILSLSVGKHLLVSYWGQNSSGVKFPQNPEKDLKDVCAERKYDIIVIGFVVTFFGKNNKGKYQ